MTSLKVLAAVLFLLLAGAGILLYPRFFGDADGRTASTTPASPLPPHAETEEYYTCPMHPSVRSDRPGACPVCGMALVKKSRSAAPDPGGSAPLGPVTLSPSQQVLANVSTVPAREARLQRAITAVGRVDYAEPSLTHIALRFPGRIEKLHVTFTGQHVSQGSPVADVYSPEAITAQKEYLLALESVERTKDAYEDIAAGAATLMAQSAQKLSRWGLTEAQVSALASSREVGETLTIYSPVSGTVTKKYAETQQYLAAGANLFDVADLSTVWAIAEVYEADLPFIRTGSRVEARADAFPEERFAGTLSFVDPVVDPGTRTTRARVALGNRSGRLKIGMYMQVRFLVDIPMSIVVPAAAILSTGDRSVVWIRSGEGTYEPRTVSVGARSGDLVQILSGIHAGEQVVASGGYLLDSESQLQSAGTRTPEDR